MLAYLLKSGVVALLQSKTIEVRSVWNWLNKESLIWTAIMTAPFSEWISWMLLELIRITSSSFSCQVSPSTVMEMFPSSTMSSSRLECQCLETEPSLWMNIFRGMCGPNSIISWRSSNIGNVLSMNFFANIGDYPKNRNEIMLTNCLSRLCRTMLPSLWYTYFQM